MPSDRRSVGLCVQLCALLRVCVCASVLMPVCFYVHTLI